MIYLIMCRIFSVFVECLTDQRSVCELRCKVVYIPIQGTRSDKHKQRKQKESQNTTVFLRLVRFIVIICLFTGVFTLTVPSNPFEHSVFLVFSSEKKTAPQPPGEAVINVKGYIMKPGIFKVTGQTDFNQVIQIANGLAPGADISGLALDQKVEDGMDIYIPGKVLVK